MTITPYDFIIDDLGMCISVLFLIFLSNEVSLYVPNFIVYCWNSWDLKFIPFFFFLYFYIRFRNLFEEQGGGLFFIFRMCSRYQNRKSWNRNTQLHNKYVRRISCNKRLFIRFARGFDIIGIIPYIFFSLLNARMCARFDRNNQFHTDVCNKVIVQTTKKNIKASTELYIYGNPHVKHFFIYTHK